MLNNRKINSPDNMNSPSLVSYKPYLKGFIFIAMSNIGQIIKSRYAGNFTVIPNDPFRREDLSLQAKGLLVYLLTLPQNWVIYKRELPNHFTNGRDATINAFNELERAGYVLSIEMRNKQGQIKGYNHIVYDKPYNKEVEPMPENPHVGKPVTNKQ